MRLSEVISEAQKLLSIYGDLPVTAHDGLNPSDLCEVNKLVVSDEEEFLAQRWTKEKHVHMHS